MNNLDLKTLLHVKFMFDLHSDMSSKCNGYKSLCEKIEQKLLVEIDTPMNFDDHAFVKWILSNCSINDNNKYSVNINHAPYLYEVDGQRSFTIDELMPIFLLLTK